MAASQRHLVIIALAVCAALYVAGMQTRQTSAAFSSIAPTLEGGFTANGEHPSEALKLVEGVRRWGSWSGNDSHQGRLTFGPFAAPATLHLGICGYPNKPGNELFLERPATGTRLAIPRPEPGESWQLITFALPTEWRGESVRLVAIDNAQAWGGWFALTEPLRGGANDPTAAFWRTLAAWAVNGVLLGAMWLAALRLLERVCSRTGALEPWLPLLASGVVAVAGYAAFWAYLAHPWIGRVVSGGLLLSAIATLLLRNRREPWPRSFIVVGRLAVITALLYLALLRLFPVPLNFYDLARSRFREELPADNMLPFVIAARLHDGGNVREPLGDWLTSDRPPLQTGWQLLTWPLLRALKFEPETASGTAAVWLQLTWIAAAYGLLRTLGLTERRTAGWIAALALSGFFLQHTVFTWPKLAAGAFACGAFALWVAPGPGLRSRGALFAGAALAALAWLAHGGVAFSFLVLVPWILWRCVRGEGRDWLAAAAVFAALAAPWVAYQKFYDPPGNRLLKWHLAGQIPIDSRTTWQTLRENYGALSWRKIWENKRINFAYQTHATWPLLFDFSRAAARQRRNEEFTHTGRAFTWWLGGILLAPFAAVRLRRHAAAPDVRRTHLALLLWVAVTIPVWCLLLFDAGAAMIHQGSYAVMIGLFVLLSFYLEAANRWLLAVIATLQAATFFTTWCIGSRDVNGAPLPAAIAVAAAAAAALGATLIAAFRSPREPLPAGSH